MLWLKAFHLIAVICWFAGIFYLPRLFVYHAMTDKDDSTSIERFKIMERKLYRGIMTPAALISIGLGIWMLLSQWGFYKTQVWMHAKLACVMLLIFYHALCGYYLNQFKQDRNTHSHVYYRYFNEVPVVLLFAIVILVIVKPI